VSQDIDWVALGVEPRWLGMETSDCAAAIDPSIFASQGAAELKRFRAGVAQRAETAVILVTVGASDGPVRTSSLFGAGASVLLASDTMVSGRRLPSGSRPHLADNLELADRDLAMRLLSRSVSAPWWSVALSGVTSTPSFGESTTTEQLVASSRFFKRILVK
jgi:hypothetical protein